MSNPSDLALLKQLGWLDQPGQPPAATPGNTLLPQSAAPAPALPNSPAAAADWAGALGTPNPALPSVLPDSAIPSALRSSKPVPVAGNAHSGAVNRPTFAGEDTGAADQPPAGPPPVEYATPGGGGAPAVPRPTFATIPAHEVPNVSPDRQAELQGAIGHQQEVLTDEQQAQKDMAEAQAGKNDADADAAKLELINRDVAENEVRNNADKRNSALNIQRIGVERAMADAANWHENPNHYMESTGTGTKILWLLAAFFKGWAGHGDEVIQDMNKEIDRDIAAQRAEYEKLKGNVESKKTLYSIARDQFDDKDKATQVAQALAWQQMSAKAKMMAAKAKTPEDRARAAQGVAQIEEKKAELGTLAVGEKIKMNPYVSAKTVQTGGGGGISAKDQGFIFRGPDGQTYKAPNEEAYKKLTAAVEGNQELDALMDNYAKAVQGLDAIDKLSLKSGTPTAAAAAAQTAYTLASSRIRKFSDEGVWKPAEAQMIASQLQPPDQLFGANAPAQTTVMKKLARNANTRAMRVYNPLPVQTGFGYNAQGQLAPTAGYTGDTFQAPNPVNPERATTK